MTPLVINLQNVVVVYWLVPNGRRVSVMRNPFIGFAFLISTRESEEERNGGIRLGVVNQATGI